MSDEMEYLYGVVVGRSALPLDMLRHDRCWPATEEWARRATPEPDAARHAVVLCRRIDGDRQEYNAARWRSFGWRYEGCRAFLSEAEALARLVEMDMAADDKKRKEGG